MRLGPCAIGRMHSPRWRLHLRVPMNIIARLFLLFLCCGPLTRAADYDLIIRDAWIADGTGAPLGKGSVAVKGGRIAVVGAVEGSASATIDAQGRVVAPGFIDVHTHSERIGRVPGAENFVRMGVTTIVTGNCGNARTDVAKFFD